MLSSVLFLGLIYFAIPVSDSTYPPDEAETSKTFCKSDSGGKGIETFASSFYTAMVVQHGFPVVAGIEVPGFEAAMLEYNYFGKALAAQGLCDAPWVAFTASRPFLCLETVPLAVYLEKSAHTVGEFLNYFGLLDCSTAIPLSFEYYKFVHNAFDGLDENEFASYMYSVIRGLVDMILHEDGIDLDAAANHLADEFYKEFNSCNQKNCTKSEN